MPLIGVDCLFLGESGTYPNFWVYNEWMFRILVFLLVALFELNPLGYGYRTKV